MKISKVFLGCVSLPGVIRADAVNGMDTLPPTESCSEPKSSMSEDILAEQKKTIDDLIPKLLNDPGEEPRIYNESNVRSLFTVLLETKSTRLCSYVVDKFVSYYFNDEFALECGIIFSVRKAQYVWNFPFSVSSRHLMEEFMHHFSITIPRLLFIRQVESKQADGE